MTLLHVSLTSRTALPDDRLAHIGETVARFLTASGEGDPVRAAVGRNLARILADGSRILADDLRRDLAALDDACTSIQRLAGLRFGAIGDGGLHALTELRRLRAATAEALATLECLTNAPETSLLAFRPDPDLVHEPNEPTGLSETAESIPTTVLFERAESLRQRDQFAQAEALYSEVLRHDPEFRPAYARRGSVALMLGNDLQATCDLTLALELEPDDPLVLALRGDAHTIGKRYDSAVADYSRALELRPSLFRPRFNRAVVLRLRGDLDEARDEFSLILKALPDHAPSQFNLGLIDEASGDHEQAMARYSEALRHDPEYGDARNHHRDLARRLAQAAPVSSQPESPTTPPPTHVTRMKRGRITVNCPHCGATGAVQWDRMGQLFHCPRCRKGFGITSGGVVVRLVQAPDGRWIDPAKPRLPSVRNSRRRWLQIAAALGVVAVLVGGAIRASVRPAPTQAVEIELPHDLPGRAELFARAWLRGDVPLMRRLTSPAHERTLYSWYTRHKPPAAWAAFPPDAAQVQVQVISTKPPQTTLRVRLANGPSSLELTQSWEERGDAWYFVPPLK